jgi:16S rRNA (guanine527-N7)-methyltransferase
VEQEHQLRDFLVRSAHELGLSLVQEQIDQFMIYLTQLLQWNKVTNLTSITDPYEVISKHFIDSLTALAAMDFPPQAVVIDVGAGAGFPGLPLKIARNDLQLVLVEPTQKKCSFLSSVVGLLKLADVSVFAGTLQQYVARAEYLQGDVVAIRALRFDEVREQANRVLKRVGRVVLYRTEKIERGSVPHGFNVESEKRFALPLSHGDRVISVLSKANDA